ncbi:MAG: transglutaminase domain-containing protein [Anaerobutyricum soehngenii]
MERTEFIKARVFSKISKSLYKSFISKMLVVILAVFLLVSGSSQIVCAATSESEFTIVQEKVYKDGELYTGWCSMGKGQKYYVVNGNRVKNWYKVGKKYYYFGDDYNLIVNSIVGSKAKGYYYVDKRGVRVTAKEIRQAVTFVMKYSDAKFSRQKRLKQCFRAIRKYPYHHMSSVAPAAKKIPSYANYMFTAQKGNCYRYGSAMAYIGRVLGYDTRLAVGAVTSRGPRASLSPHGWCEIKTGKNWKMIDCSMQRFNLKKNLFLVTRKKYPYRLRCDKVHAMVVRNGKVKWF